VPRGVAKLKPEMQAGLQTLRYLEEHFSVAGEEIQPVDAVSLRTPHHPKDVGREDGRSNTRCDVDKRPVARAGLRSEPSDPRSPSHQRAEAGRCV
jgi:hypothetical protein